MDVHVGLSAEILYFVDPWLQFPTFEDGRSVTGRRVHGRGQSEGNNAANTGRYTGVCRPHLRSVCHNRHARKGIDSKGKGNEVRALALFETQLPDPLPFWTPIRTG